jgi:hypothetical protein
MNLKIGRQFHSEGIYIARRKFLDMRGNCLGDYYFFAAPNNLEGSRTFVDTTNCISGLINWNGHDGFKVKNPRDYSREFVAGLNDGSAEGKWSIPMIEDAKRLYSLRNTGEFRDTFQINGPAYIRWLWSVSFPSHQSGVKIVDFSDGLEDWDYNITFRASCRPVRMIEVNHFRCH